MFVGDIGFHWVPKIPLATSKKEQNNCINNQAICCEWSLPVLRIPLDPHRPLLCWVVAAIPGDDAGDDQEHPAAYLLLWVLLLYSDACPMPYCCCFSAACRLHTYEGEVCISHLHVPEIAAMLMVHRASAFIC